MTSSIRNKIFELCIIGAGPAGLMAAMQAAREGLSVVLLERSRPGGQALAANRVENFPGFLKGISGRRLMDIFIAQVKKYGIRAKKQQVQKIFLNVRHSRGSKRESRSNQLDPRFGSTSLTTMSLSNGRGDDNPCIFHIKTNKSSYLARTVIIASGLAPKKLNVPGEKKLSGKNIFYYGSPEYAKGSVKNVLIIGGGDAALDSALGFHKKGKNVTVAMRSRVSKSNPYLQKMFSRSNIVLLPEHEVNFFKKDGSKVVVKFANGKKIRCDLVSICAGKQKNFPFLPDDFLANPPAGLYFAGDCARGRDRHIAIACGDGIAAAMKAGEYLSIEGRGTWDERRKNSYRPSS